VTIIFFLEESIKYLMSALDRIISRIYSKALYSAACKYWYSAYLYCGNSGVEIPGTAYLIIQSSLPIKKTVPLIPMHSLINFKTYILKFVLLINLG
jgi:hypothetical protein